MGLLRATRERIVMSVGHSYDEAAHWVLRVRNRDVDWEQLTIWLEKDEANRLAFDRLSLLDAELDGLGPAQPVRQQPTANRRPWAVAGIAFAAIAAAMLVVLLLPAGMADRRFETGPAERREVALEDGSIVQLNGSTVLLVDARNPRSVRLEKGEAYFAIAHGHDKPFRVQAGNSTIEDVGTSFDVVRDGANVEVGVSDGTVFFRTGVRSLKLTKGMAVRYEDSQAMLTEVDPATVAGWRTGQLSYADASLERIATDLQRARGVHIEIAPELHARRFSGTIQLGGSEGTLVGRMAALNGATAVRTGNGWRLTKHRGAAS